MNTETFKFSLHVCGCGYKTGYSGNAARHRKVAGGHEMKNELKVDNS